MPQRQKQKKIGQEAIEKKKKKKKKKEKRDSKKKLRLVNIIIFAPRPFMNNPSPRLLRVQFLSKGMSLCPK